VPDRRRRSTARPGRARSIAAWSVAAFAFALLAFTVIRSFIQWRSGLLAYATIVEPYLVLLLAAVSLALLWARRPIPAAIVAVALVVGIVRVGSEWLSLPVETAPDDLVVITWNLHINSRPPDESVAFLLDDALEADVVALQELTDDVAATLEADPAVNVRYPYRVLDPTNNTLGMGVLSRYPLTDPDEFSAPSGIEITVATPAGPVTLINAHPMPAAIAPPFVFDPARRDREIARVRIRIDAALDRGEVVLVAGDYNVTPTEAAYRDLVAGLRDVHTDAGLGPGWTWRPKRVEPFGIGVIRIDYVFVGPGLEPVSSSVHCPPTGDHCLVLSRVRST
jgi:endonuclease/exonuclease/phosphatase (EEP) superfamily protein YafD